MEETRFAGFSHGDVFGFDQLKKIKITVSPPSVEEPFWATKHTEAAERGRTGSAILTSSLRNCKTSTKAWLQAGVPSSPLSTTFANTLRKQPTSTSIHNLSDVEVILLPFSILRSHKVDIRLPTVFGGHSNTDNFVDSLRTDACPHTSQKNTGQLGFMDHEAVLHIRGLYHDLARFMMAGLYGAARPDNSFIFPNLSAEDMIEDEESVRQVLFTASLERTSSGKRRKTMRVGDGHVGEKVATRCDEENDMQYAVAAPLPTATTATRKDRYDQATSDATDSAANGTLGVKRQDSMGRGE
ncbi:hypothetical protein BAUCODRAFT_129393 [Baudoinia panamericana UAMH 10762]|uniref:Uncharacterized protein n=1 Tax=Baudoinia panamericana (strain UAMH 10762) TaxID=717646 RepID=M2NIF4_BAUPA|nr:uncharacterized protein BAUCODRAFT_129393 [Baudoinia panamericana UAMH 10762]EMC99164.1 hypothetical protein BAUCODRAFT_129393 [Baudoinia panamericana UAMH 10762]